MDKALIKSKLKGSELLFLAIKLISEKKVIRKKNRCDIGELLLLSNKRII